MKRTWFTCSAILALGVLLHFIVLALFGAEVVAVVIESGAFLLAGAIAARQAPRMKLLVGIALAIPGGVIAGAGDAAFGLLGGYSADWPGLLNSLLVGIIVVPIGLILATVGAFFGANYSMKGTDV